jgi:hypothetical protein
MAKQEASANSIQNSAQTNPNEKKFFVHAVNHFPEK